MLALNPVKYKDRDGRNRKEATLEGPLEEVLSAVIVDLHRDWQQNLAEADEAPYLFCYVLMSHETDPSRLDVLTRLYHPEQAGSILYGSTIKRITESLFIAWIDG